MFKFYNELSPPIMDNTFKLKTEDPYNLRQVSKFRDYGMCFRPL